MRSTARRTMVRGIFLILSGMIGSAQAKVTGIRFDPQSPVVGDTVTAIAVDDQKDNVTEWEWNYKLADAGTDNGTVAITSATPGRATFQLGCGGTYTIRVKVSYGGPTTTTQETISVPLVVARPDGVKFIEGFLDSPVRYFAKTSGVQIRWQIKSGSADVGESLVGMTQRRIRNRKWWNERRDPDQAWQPSTNEFWHSGGVLHSTACLTCDPDDWGKIRSGERIAAWEADWQLTYSVGKFGPTHGGGKLVQIACPLGTKHFAIYKFDRDHWVVRETEPWRRWYSRLFELAF